MHPSTKQGVSHIHNMSAGEALCPNRDLRLNIASKKSIAARDKSYTVRSDEGLCPISSGEVHIYDMHAWPHVMSSTSTGVSHRSSRHKEEDGTNLIGCVYVATVIPRTAPRSHKSVHKIS